MNELNNFYQSLLNIRQKDEETTIKNIVLEETQILKKQTTDLTGLCKYIATQIEGRLKQANISTYWIDLQELVSVDHTILIAEYMYNNQLKRFLIDPTYQQFTKNNQYHLIKLKQWPSEKLGKTILEPLLTKGLTPIDNQTFKNYINSFTDTNIDITLDNYLLNEKINPSKKR